MTDTHRGLLREGFLLSSFPEGKALPTAKGATSLAFPRAPLVLPVRQLINIKIDKCSKSCHSYRSVCIIRQTNMKQNSQNKKQTGKNTNKKKKTYLGTGNEPFQSTGADQSASLRAASSPARGERLLREGQTSAAALRPHRGPPGAAAAAPGPRWATAGPPLGPHRSPPGPGTASALHLPAQPPPSHSPHTTFPSRTFCGCPLGPPGAPT